MFTFGVAAAVFNGYDGGKLAATIGGSLAVGIIVAGIASNAIINPAAALGADSWSKAYVVGPLVGGLLGVNLYGLLFAERARVVAKAGTAKKTKRTSRRK